MPIGPGKYDDLCTKIRTEVCAKAVILIITDGDKGSGFSMQAPFEFSLMMPMMLRDLANQIETGLKQGKI